MRERGDLVGNVVNIDDMRIMLSLFRQDQIPVSEAEIRYFCSGCDKLQPNNSCLLVGYRNQEKAVLKQDCQWAAQGFTLGRMTANGFMEGRRLQIIKRVKVIYFTEE